MVLATKSKNTNILIRILLVILSLALFAGAYFNAAGLFNYSKAYNLSEVIRNDRYIINENTPLSSSNHLEGFLGSDIHSAEITLLLKKPDYCKKKLEAQREKLINQIINDYKNNADESAEGENFTIPYEISLGDASVQFSLETSNPKAQIVYGESLEQAKEKANLRFTEFIESGEYMSELQSSFDELKGEIHSDFHYYIKDGKNNVYVTNFDDGTVPQNVLKRPYSFVIKGDTIQNSDEFKELFVQSVENNVNKVDKELFKYDEYYVYIDEEQNDTNSIMNYIQFAKNQRKVNPKLLLVRFSVMIALSAIFALLYFILCGTRNKDGKVKRFFLDYVPSDLHFIINCGLIGLLALLWAHIVDNTVVLHTITLGRTYTVLSLLVVALMYYLIIEFISSVIRVCKSEKPIYKNTLFYYIVIKPLKFVFSVLKDAMTFKPNNFKKPLTNSIVIYAIINSAFFWMIVLSVIGGEAVLAGIAGILALFFNIGAAVYAAWYIIQLDRIISAAHYRQLPQVNYNKLPQSLKCLCASISYTKQELENAVNKAVSDERMRTELITNVSHDLKTPLTSIITYVDLLKKCNIQDEAAREYIEVLDEKGTRLKRLIDDLVEASKITSGVITINSAEISLSELAAQAIYERQGEFEANGLELIFKGDRKSVKCYADGNKTYRVIENLLSNAKKYSASPSRVYCDVYKVQNYSVFEIKNISAQQLDISPDELKERFVRGDKSRTNEGNGLGLSIADNLCKAQGGRLNIIIDGDMFKAQVMLPETK